MLSMAQFNKYDTENPRVWILFERFSLQVAAQRATFGAKAVMERVRWFSMFESNGQPFKVGNNWTAFYARKFMDTHKKHRGFFQLRSSQADTIE